MIYGIMHVIVSISLLLDEFMLKKKVRMGVEGKGLGEVIYCA
jgi:hypothetical protein